MKRQPHTKTKPAPAAKSSRNLRAPVAAAPVVPVEFKPVVEFKPTLVPIGNGGFEVRPGKPIVTSRDAEISAAEFAVRVGLSREHVSRLCDTGHIKCRRKSPRARSPYLIPVSEVQRFLTADPHEFPKPKGAQ
jgi:hypothetical protein